MFLDMNMSSIFGKITLMRSDKEFEQKQAFLLLAARFFQECCSGLLQFGRSLLCALQGSHRHPQPVCCFQVLDDS